MGPARPGERAGIPGQSRCSAAQCVAWTFLRGFYANLRDMFAVEYYGIHAKWFYDLIRSDDLTEYCPHKYAAIKPLRNFPASRSLAEDHRKTAFFGISAIQCTSVALTPPEVELFKKSVRGTLQGAIRLDMSVERLVAGMTGKDSNMSVEDFFATKAAVPVIKHYGSLY